MEVKIASKEPFRLKEGYTNQWQEKTAALHRWDFAKACVFAQDEYGDVTGLRLLFEDGRSDELRYNTYGLANLPIEEFERDLRELASRPYGKRREVLQHIYDYFREHNEWPKSRAIRTELFEEYGDLFQLESEIGRAWISVERDSANKRDWVSLTFRSVALLKNSEEDIDSFFKALNAVVEAYKAGGGEPVDFTVQKIQELAGLTPSQAQRVCYFLVDRQLCQRHTPAPDGSIRSFQPSDNILHFSKVRSVEDYLRVCEPIASPGQLEEIGGSAAASVPLQQSSSTEQDEDFEYDIALSFAGEEREYVGRVAEALRLQGIRVFYDKYEQASLWGEDLVERLDEVYRKRARYCLMFASEHYAKKAWTTHERRSAQARLLQQKGAYILPARFDDTEIPGLRPTVGYIDLREVSLEELVSLVLEKIRGTSQSPPLSLEPESIPEDSGSADSLEKETELTAAEQEILLAVRDDEGIMLMQADQSGKWIRIGRRDFADQSKPSYAVRYLKALEALEDREYVYEQGDNYYILTEEGVEVASQLREDESHHLLLSLGTVHRRTATGQDLAELVLENNEDKAVEVAFVHMDKRGDLADVVHRDTFGEIISQINREFGSESLMIRTNGHKKLYDDINVKYVKYLALRIRYKDHQGVEREQTVVRA